MSTISFRKYKQKVVLLLIYLSNYDSSKSTFSMLNIAWYLTLSSVGFLSNKLPFFVSCNTFFFFVMYILVCTFASYFVTFLVCTLVNLLLRCCGSEYIFLTESGISLNKKWNFPLRISPVNMTGNCGLVTFTVEILNGKLNFLCSVYCWQSQRFLFWTPLKTRVKHRKQPLELFC